MTTMARSDWRVLVLRRNGSPAYITRIYIRGHEENLGAWEDEVLQDFDAICRAHNDDPAQCHLRGEAKWVWMKCGPKYCRVKLEEFSGAEPVTMIRVHRNRTPAVKRQAK